jgi:aspartate carbamoyltransferase regulatory subunit
MGLCGKCSEYAREMGEVEFPWMHCHHENCVCSDASFLKYKETLKYLYCPYCGRKL